MVVLRLTFEIIKMQIISHRKIWFAISGILVLASIVILILWRLNLGIDFTGGTILEVEYNAQRPSTEEIDKSLAPLKLENLSFQPIGDKGVIFRMKDVTEDTHQEILKNLGDVTEKRFNSIGPTIGVELQKRSLIAIGLVLGMIILYIAYAFRKVSRPVASWKYGVVAILALIHDIAIPLGIFVTLGKFYGVEIDILFVTALLTILGFSVHDTIVVFDRIRENLKKSGAENFEQIVEQSVKETITRSINTSLTVVLTLLAILFFGGQSIRYFILALLIGIIAGTYSSIFIASPLLVTWQKMSVQRRYRFDI